MPVGSRLDMLPFSNTSHPSPKAPFFRCKEFPIMGSSVYNGMEESNLLYLTIYYATMTVKIILLTLFVMFTNKHAYTNLYLDPTSVYGGNLCKKSGYF